MERPRAAGARQARAAPSIAAPAAGFDQPFELPAPGGRPRQLPGRLRAERVVLRLHPRDQRARVRAFLIDAIVGDEIERLFGAPARSTTAS